MDPSPTAPSPKKRKASEQMAAAPLAHKMIEKKRRDRMRDSMEMLKTLVPTARSCQENKNVVKVDILRMTIDYLREIQEGRQAPEPSHPTVKTGNGIPSPAALAAHRQRGMEDCLQDIRHYLMEVESIAPRDPSLVALLAHLRFWTRSKEEEAAAAHTATADKQSDAHDQSLDSFPGSSLESTPSIPSNIQPQPKRLLGRPSDLLQAAAALRSPSEPSFLSPTAHEYSSGLDLISSVAQQSSLATSTEKAVQLPSRTSSQQVEVLVPVLNSQNSQDQQPLRQQSAEETPRRAVVVMPLAANSQQATASSGEASHLAFPVESLPYIEPMASSQAQPTVLAPMTASWSSHVLAQTTSQASASSGSAVSVAVPQQGSSGHSVMNPNVQGGQEWK